MGEDFVGHDGGVVVDVDVFDGEGGDLGEEDAAEGVGDGGIDVDEGKGGFEGQVAVELYLEGLVLGVRWHIQYVKYLRWCEICSK